MASVTFVYADWAARYPALAATVTQETAEAMFADAELFYLGNDLPDQPPSLVKNEAMRLRLFYLLVSHLASLDIRSRNGGGAGAGMVGNVTSASEGSVSIGLQGLPTSSQALAWYNQTQYGAAFVQALLGATRAMYVPGPRPFVGVSTRRPYYGR